MYKYNPLALNHRQKMDLEEKGRIFLSRTQISHLQRNGLVTGADEWHYHEAGFFALAPRNANLRKRERMNLTPGRG